MIKMKRRVSCDSSHSNVGVSKKIEKPSKSRKKTKKIESKKKTDYFFCKNFRFGSVSVYETRNRQNPNRTEPVRFKVYYKYEKKTLSNF
jgi:hypothetical protein